MSNANHPAKGSIIQVEPIRDLDKIEEIEQMLASNTRNLSFFVFGVNTNIRAIDLGRLTVGDVRNLLPGDNLVLREKKTQKVRQITLNKKVHQTLAAWLAEHPMAYNDAAPLYISSRGDKALTVSTMSRLVKTWCRQVGLKGNYAAHTLSKTFGYVQRVVHGTDIAVLMTMFNHSSQKQTLTYLGVDDDEVRSAYLKEI